MRIHIYASYWIGGCVIVFVLAVAVLGVVLIDRDRGHKLQLPSITMDGGKR